MYVKLILGSFRVMFLGIYSELILLHGIYKWSKRFIFLSILFFVSFLILFFFFFFLCENLLPLTSLSSGHMSEYPLIPVYMKINSMVSCLILMGVWGGNFGVIVIRVFEPVFQNLPNSCTWPLKNGPIRILHHPKC